MRIATYNTQWFDHLFDDHARLWNDDGRGGREGVTRAEQTAGLGHVFRALDADAVLVVEAPDARHRTRDGTPALEVFARHFGLRTREVLMGFHSHSQQEIALLYDPAVLTVRHDPQGGDPPRFDGTWRVAFNGNPPEPIVWAKPPLEIEALTAKGNALRLIGVHAKSKAPHGARNESQVARIALETGASSSRNASGSAPGWTGTSPPRTPSSCWATSTTAPAKTRRRSTSAAPAWRSSWARRGPSISTILTPASRSAALPQPRPPPRASACRRTDAGSRRSSTM